MASAEMAECWGQGVGLRVRRWATWGSGRRDALAAGTVGASGAQLRAVPRSGGVGGFGGVGREGLSER